MQTLTYVLYQMDEARRYIEGGRLEQLRLALLLLDNAAELQVERRVRDERQSESMIERIRERTLRLRASIPKEHPTPERLQELMDIHPMSTREQWRLARYFDAKLTYLSDHRGVLDARLASVLAALHRYRNEAYHEGRVRVATVRTAGLIAFEANCLLLLNVFQVRMFSSREDYSWLCERFNLDRPGGMLFRAGLEEVVDQLRSSTLPSLPSVVAALTDHLESRFQELWEAVDFIVANTPAATREEALRVSQIERDQEIDPEHVDRLIRALVPRWSETEVTALESRVSEITTAHDRLEAFARFSELESQLEEIEQPTFTFASDIDAAIQLQIDQVRGK